VISCSPIAELTRVARQRAGGGRASRHGDKTSRRSAVRGCSNHVSGTRLLLCEFPR